MKLKKSMQDKHHPDFPGAGIQVPVPYPFVIFSDFLE